jgi:DNA-binding PadR family transcriptional regulator
MPRQQSPLTVEYILLGLLTARPMHGYDLNKRVNELSGVSMVWHVKQSQLYALLERLESERLLGSKLVSGEAYPLRKEYSITQKGLAVFFDWIHSPVQHGRDMRQEFLARLYFALQQDNSTVKGLLLKQKDTCQDWINTLQTQYDHLNKTQQYEKMVIDYRIHQVEAMIRWLDNCTKQYDSE